MTRQHWQILLCVLAMHLSLLSLILAPVNWRYLLCAEASAFVLFGALGWFPRRHRRRLLLLAIPLLMAVQQWAWHKWRADIASTWWPHLRYGFVQLVVLLLCRTFLWRDAAPPQ
jgi:hypothetical protein